MEMANHTASAMIWGMMLNFFRDSWTSEIVSAIIVAAIG